MNLHGFKVKKIPLCSEFWLSLEIARNTDSPISIAEAEFR